MIELEPTRWKTPPFAHQIEDVKLLISQPSFGLFSEMGTGKTKTVIDTVCTLCEANDLDTVLVVSPAAVRCVWLDSDFGEVRKHAWVPSRVFEYHGGKMKLVWMDPNARLNWIVTNYEFIRPMSNRELLIGTLGDKKLMMVLDESSFIKSRKAIQTRACLDVGKLASRRIILNGTPISNNPLDLWSQLVFLSPKILPYHNFYQFRANFAVLGGWQNKQVVKWKNLEKLQELVKPYVIRREKKDCLDLPDKIYTQQEVPISEENWKTYRQMRDDAVVWLNENPSMAAQAGVRVMRLSQITSGFLGGFQSEDILEQKPAPREVGREKLDWLLAWTRERLLESPRLKVIVWCRFRPEIERVARELAAVLPTYKLYGSQTKDDRTEAVRYFSRVDDATGPAMLVAQPQAGGFGLNLVAASVVVYLSNDFNLLTRLQSEDRVHRPGQTQHVVYVDVLATGPKGQRTVDHGVVKALRAKNDLAQWTCSAWRQILTEPEETV